MVGEVGLMGWDGRLCEAPYHVGWLSPHSPLRVIVWGFQRRVPLRGTAYAVNIASARLPGRSGSYPHIRRFASSYGGFNDVCLCEALPMHGSTAMRYASEKHRLLKAPHESA